MDAIFKALGDDTRRQLLDMLRERDGQTLSELESKLGMTRFGVMKHLKILEEASLVVRESPDASNTTALTRFRFKRSLTAGSTRLCKSRCPAWCWT